jgi:hypothetical protein
VRGSDRQYETQHVTLLTSIERRDRDRLRTKAEPIPALAGAGGA